MAATIGFIGTGHMGLPVAQNLLKSGYNLRVYNRTREKAEPLAREGATIVTHPVDVCERGGIVLTVLSNDDALVEIATAESEFARRLDRGGVHVSMSTVSPETSRHITQQHGRYGVMYVAAPVFGRPDAAAARKLWICVSGDRSAKDRVQPILSEISQGIFDFGEDAGAANVVKLAGNFLLATALEALGEAAVLAEKNGIGRKPLIDTLTSTIFPCPVYQNYGRMIAEESYTKAGFTLSLGLKDMNLVLRTAASSETRMPVAELLQRRFATAVNKGRADLDWSAIALEALDDAGLEVERAR